MTGQLALDLGPIPVLEAHHRGGNVPLIVRAGGRVTVPPVRKAYMWWRGRKRHVANVPVTIGGVL